MSLPLSSPTQPSFSLYTHTHTHTHTHTISCECYKDITTTYTVTTKQVFIVVYSTSLIRSMTELVLQFTQNIIHQCQSAAASMTLTHTANFHFQDKNTRKPPLVKQITRTKVHMYCIYNYIYSCTSLNISLLLLFYRYDYLASL